MKTREEIITELQKNEVHTNWKEQLLWRRENRYWLRYSQMIAVLMLDKMDKEHLTQREVASKLGCSQQCVSRILKGSENMSLKTIAKIESVLGLSFFNHPYYN